MQNSQKQVKEFHEKFDLMINETPTVVDEATLKLRCKLLLEEVIEFCTAAGYDVISCDDDESLNLFSSGKVPNLVEMADALTDIQYVNDGAALALGIDLEPIANEVHRSNMSKLWNVNEIEKLRSDTENNWQAKGDAYSGFVVKNEHGKVIKSPSYSPADIKTELNKQGANL